MKQFAYLWISICLFILGCSRVTSDQPFNEILFCNTLSDSITNYVNKTLNRERYCLDVYNPYWDITYHSRLNAFFFKDRKNSDRCSPVSVIQDSKGNRYILYYMKYQYPPTQDSNWIRLHDENLSELNNFIQNNSLNYYEASEWVYELLRLHYPWMIPIEYNNIIQQKKWADAGELVSNNNSYSKTLKDSINYCKVFFTYNEVIYGYRLVYEDTTKSPYLFSIEFAADHVP